MRKSNIIDYKNIQKPKTRFPIKEAGFGSQKLKTWQGLLVAL